MVTSTTPKEFEEEVRMHALMAGRRRERERERASRRDVCVCAYMAVMCDWDLHSEEKERSGERDILFGFKPWHWGNKKAGFPSLAVADCALARSLASKALPADPRRQRIKLESARERKRKIKEHSSDSTAKCARMHRFGMCSSRSCTPTVLVLHYLKWLGHSLSGFAHDHHRSHGNLKRKIIPRG